MAIIINFVQYFYVLDRKNPPKTPEAKNPPDLDSSNRRGDNFNRCLGRNIQIDQTYTGRYNRIANYRPGHKGY